MRLFTHFSQVAWSPASFDLVMQGTYVRQVQSSWPKDESIIALHQFQLVARPDTQRVNHARGKRNLPLGGYLYNHDMSPYQWIK